MSDETTELLRVGDILFNETCDERLVVIAADERNVWLRKVGKNDELVMLDGSVWAMLGLERNVKSMCTQSYAQHMFELDGHVGQAELVTHGTLTAELVERIVDRNCEWYEGGEIDAQAIVDELNAVLGGEPNPDGLPNGLTISDDGTLLNWRGENYVKQSTLGGGTLTAEQVQAAIFSHSSCAGRVDGKYFAEDIRMQAVADELNAEIGSGTCEQKKVR